ncbi:MAG: hypothetical protein UY92_C0015G0054 [Candidatus Magasanikbacteria bacterium GW2011_GWA2_56_11]|uniref:Uncharacterized protein n=1 Tax=Candidatus Magasanikbacteria bacterium GW2011_GWA2_56_11 TaxID=1619044 RepID=A0A0G2AK90_9BACT|nr:MAG: hypothetical protein UY92_C0015G0054 [Candidatus Magasanikbacteria bacterium GW2011_GWA2_56_11]
MVINHSIKNFEYEIVHQILFSELCFDICQSVKIIPGRGSDFLPFFYNLNFIKGIISLHSLLESGNSDELSVKNYFKEHKYNYPRADVGDFKKEIESVAKAFKKVTPLCLRHKIGAHIDGEFTHTDFTSAYIMPELVPKYCEVVRQLKNAFFKFCNYSRNDDPFSKIKEQSKFVIDNIVKSTF